MPDSWSDHSLRDCLADEFPGEWGTDPGGGGNATVLRSTDIDDEGHVDVNGGARRSIEAAKLARKRLHPGDILLEGSGGGPGKPVGRVALFRGGDRDAYVCSNFFRTLRPRDAVDSSFLAWRLQYLYSTPGIWVFQQQTTGIINLRFRDYVASRLLLPPLPEQRRIAEVLDTIDEAIRKAEELIAKLKQVKQGLLHDLLTRGIDDNGELRDPDRNPEQFKDSPLGRIPKAWDVVALGSLMLEVYRYPTYYGIQYVEQGVPEIRGELLRSDGLVEPDRRQYRYIDDVTANRFPRVRLSPGDFVMSVRGTLGKICVVPDWLSGAVITANLIKMTFDSARIDPRWAVHMLLAPRFQASLDLASSATTIKTIQVPALKSILIAVPSVSEQRAVSAALDRVSDRLCAEASLVEKLKVQKRGLMDDLLTGRVRVTPLLAEAAE